MACICMSERTMHHICHIVQILLEKSFIMQLRAPLLLLAPRLAWSWCVVYTLDVQKLSCMLQKRRETTTACVWSCTWTFRRATTIRQASFSILVTIYAVGLFFVNIYMLFNRLPGCVYSSINGPPKGLFSECQAYIWLNLEYTRRSIENTCNLLRGL